jgi:hypothetical protein
LKCQLATTEASDKRLRQMVNEKDNQIYGFKNINNKNSMTEKRKLSDVSEEINRLK